MNRIQVGRYYWYDENDLLGEGTFGKVYKGHSELDTNLQLVIKRILKGKIPQKYIDQEIQILQDISRSDVQHVNLVTLLDHSETEEFVYLIMEFCNGGDLEKYLEDNGRMDEPSLKAFLQQMASGLKILHDHKIIHRDLKPANVLISYSGTHDIGHATFKIADFGIGRFLDAEAEAGTCCGTPAFMAPEVCVPNRKYDYKVDLWSLGAIVYNCFTGTLHSKQEPIRLPENTNPYLKDLLTKLLHNDPKERLSFDEFYHHPFIDMMFRREFFIVSEMNGRVLDISLGDSSPGALVVVWSKNSPRSKNQLWYRDNSGFIHSALNDLVPESRGGAQVKMAHLSGDISQQWTVDGNKIVSMAGECLDINASDSEDGAKVISYAYANTSNQHWRLEYVWTPEQREFLIISEMNGKVLDISGGDSSPGTLVEVWVKNSPLSMNQLWYRDSSGFIHSALNYLVPESRGGAQVKMAHLSGDGSQQWTFDGNKIVSMVGECLDINASDSEDGAKVISYAYANTSNQHWRLEYVLNSKQCEFFIVSEMNGKVLDISGGDSSPGALVVVWSKKSSRSTSQLWYRDSSGFIHSALNYLVPESRGGAQVKMAHLSGDRSQQWTVDGNKIVSMAGECLDINASDSGNGAKVISYAYGNTSNQHWRLEFVLNPDKSSNDEL